MTTPGQERKIGLWTSTSLVIGNMIGSGVFLLPATLAAHGGISIFGWLGSSLGAIVLALLFSRLSKKIPNALGGPYAYSKAGLGEFAGFLVAWGYWMSIWATNASLAIGFVSYLGVFIPELVENTPLAIGTGVGAVWFLTWINTLGVKEAGFVQAITVILKLIPLILISIVGLFFVNMDNFIPFNATDQSNFAVITATATLTLFAFLGLESATIPTGNVENPERTIPRATMIGTVVTIVVYILGSFAVMGMIPNETLKVSNAPYADAAAIMWGENARYLVAFGAIVSTFGALNGWILLQGQMPLAAAKDKLMPKIFARENKRGVPYVGIIISSVLISVLMLMSKSDSLGEMYEFMILLTTLTVLIAFIFSAAAYGVLILQDKYWKKTQISNMIIAILAFVFSLWAIVGAGAETVYWGFVALLAGVPFYIWMKRSE